MSNTFLLILVGLFVGMTLGSLLDRPFDIGRTLYFCGAAILNVGVFFMKRG